jgi:YidC/Oxa1 family membrane protein insertase
MEKNTILAVALSVLVFIGFQWYQQKYMTPERGNKVEQTGAQVAESKKAETPKLVEAPAGIAAGGVRTLQGASDTTATAQSMVIENDLYRAVVDNKGAVLTGWELKKYKSAKGRVFEMIATAHDSGIPTFPSTLIFQDQGITSVANGELYEVTVDGGGPASGKLVPPVSITFKLKRGDLKVEKRFRFEKDNYLMTVSANAERGGAPLNGQFILGQDIGPELEHLDSSIKLEAVYYGGDKVKRESAPKDENDRQVGQGVRWVGLDMHYFSMIAIPSQAVSYFELKKKAVQAEGLDGKKVDRDLLRIGIPMSGSLESQLYIGPKKQADLQAVKSADITGVINYGMFSVIVLPLLWALRWIFQYVHNYGYAIIILTMLLSLLLFPFRLKQMLSMKKMQVVQPKVKAIQDKYRKYKKTDPKRTEMNQEIMALYREHNVNPLGGCLPLLLQFPLLLAFYSLLANSIELRQAPFIGWLIDLSGKDPYYVLPVVMGITMFISQKMTPMAPGSDPAQAKMMMVMPFIFMFMFLNVSSGLNLYFLCSNIFQVGFQKIAEKWIKDGRTADATRS